MCAIDRRCFLTAGAAWLGCAASAHAFWPFGGGSGNRLSGSDIRARVFRADAPERLPVYAHDAYSYKRLENRQVVCLVCPHRCLLSPGDRSACRSKVNMGGSLYTLAYGNPCAVHIDPVEKKPLYHFLPGIAVFSVAAAGCNFRCLNCQNWEISQFAPDRIQQQVLSPPQAVAAAVEADCRAIAYTYSEPVTFIEYMAAIAGAARSENLKNFMISNGYINTGPLKELCRVVDGANINLKAFDDAIYRKLNGGRLDPVLDTLALLHEQGVHLEITNLVVPGYTDDLALVERMCRWIVEHLGPDHPLHFLRFFPKYKLDRLAPTPVSTLTRCRQIAMAAGIRYVYLGNVPGHEGNHTFCHHCGKMIIERYGYQLPQYHLKGDRCRFCGTKIPGVWSGSAS